MRILFAVCLLLAMACSAHAQCWKITSRGHESVWAVTETCKGGTCQTAQPAVKPTAQALPDAPAKSGTITYSSGSCSDGSCSQPRGLFRRWR